jgi:hypothetical protein
VCSSDLFLEQQYPDKNFSIFACKGQYKDQVQAMVFLMNNRSRLGNGIKIGFKDLHCRYPGNSVQNSLLDAIEAVDLTPYSNEQLKSYGWTLISPEYLYNSLLNY